MSDIIMKFGNVSDNSAYDNILKESRQKRPRPNVTQRSIICYG